MCLVKEHLQNADIEEWGKVCRVDSDAGDMMSALSLYGHWYGEDTRDATYVWVRQWSGWSILCTLLTNNCSTKCLSTARCRPEYELQTFFGQLQHIFLVRFQAATCINLGFSNGAVIILVAIKTCVLDDTLIGSYKAWIFGSICQRRWFMLSISPQTLQHIICDITGGE